MKVSDPVGEAVAEELLDIAMHCLTRVRERATVGDQELGRMLADFVYEIELVAEEIKYPNVYKRVIERRLSPQSRMGKLSSALLP